MPPFAWPGDPIKIVQTFEVRHASPAAGALILFALRAVDSLYYLQDLDRKDDLSKGTIDGHAPDVVDVAHARWATTTCVTALDLCAAGLGRALCGYTKSRELDLVELSQAKKPWRQRLPPAAAAWVDAALADVRYKQIVEARNLLIHAHITRHFSMPRQRLRLGLTSGHIDVPTLIECSLEVGTEKMLELVNELPDL